MRNVRNLKAWHKSHQLTLAIYTATSTFPKEERYGLTGQIRRSSVSIAANIAEGCGRDGSNELVRFCQISGGSASELEYHLLLAHDLHFLGSSDYEKLTAQVIEVKRMLTSFIRKLKPKADR